MAPVRVRRSRKASKSERLMRSPMRVPNLLAFSSRVWIPCRIRERIGAWRRVLAHPRNLWVG